MSGTADSELAYFDSGIWVSSVVGPSDRHFDKCLPLIRDLEDGRKTAVVPGLVVLETTNVLRKMPYRGALYSDPADAGLRLSQQLVADFYASMERLYRDGMIMRPALGMKLADHYDAAIGKYRLHRGRLRSVRACPGCGSRAYRGRGDARCPSCGRAVASVERYAYKALDHVDMEHALLAKHSGAAALYTVDRSFEDLAGDPYFAPMRFVVV